MRLERGAGKWSGMPRDTHNIIIIQGKKRRLRNSSVGQIENDARIKTFKAGIIIFFFVNSDTKCVVRDLERAVRNREMRTN